MPDTRGTPRSPRSRQRLLPELIGLVLFVVVALAISVRLRLFQQWVVVLTRFRGLDLVEYWMLPVLLAVAFAVFAVRRWRQFKQTANRLAALTQATQIISSTLDPEQVAEKIVEAVRDLMGYTQLALMAVTGDQLVAMVWSGFETPPPQLTTAQGIVGRVARTGVPAYVPDVSRDPEFMPLVAGTASEIAHPVFVDGRIAAVLTVETAGGRILTPEDADLVGTLASQIGIALRNAALHAEMREQALRDGLTGLYDHAAFQQRLHEEVTRAQRYGRTLAVVMIDMDGFKQVNDQFGHPVGDQVLRMFAETLRTGIRTEDAAARYGGEEFAVIMPETGAPGAARAAMRIRDRFAQQPIEVDGVPVTVTVSFGVAAMPEHGAMGPVLVKAADDALYEAKRAGKDRVRIAEAVSAAPQTT
ncbi:MAG TPA: sensor domain-containing diguanylate cyclase [bacterium]|nr:sensor domain-containing diguanylate cyclase [bacterium]